jgi:hypothetical protein
VRRSASRGLTRTDRPGRAFGTSSGRSPTRRALTGLEPHLVVPDFVVGADHKSTPRSSSRRDRRSVGSA